MSLKDIKKMKVKTLSTDRVVISKAIFRNYFLLCCSYKKKGVYSACFCHTNFEFGSSYNHTDREMTVSRCDWAGFVRKVFSSWLMLFLSVCWSLQVRKWCKTLCYPAIWWMTIFKSCYDQSLLAWMQFCHGKWGGQFTNSEPDDAKLSVISTF